MSVVRPTHLVKPQPKRDTIQVGGQVFGPDDLGGASSIAELTDVDLTGLGDGNVLIWDDATDTWLVGPLPTGTVALADIETHHRFVVTAHRGDIGSDDSYPENTLEGIRQAAIKGADRIEIDVQLSADDTWWVFHDDTATRTTDGTGNFQAKTDAAIAALNIDGGFGYDAGRHGASLNVPTLDDVLDAIEPYDVVVYFHMVFGSDADHTSIANYIVARGWEQRAIVLVNSIAGGENVKAVSSVIRTSAMSFVTDDPLAEPGIDWWLALANTPDQVTAMTDITSRAPAQVGVVVLTDDYATDEEAWLREAFGWGARDFMTNHLDAALALRTELLLGASLVDGLVPVDQLPVGIAAGEVAAGDHTHPAAAGGELLLSSTASVPPVFGDILTTSDETDFVYSS